MKKVTVLYEGNFIKNALSKSKDWLKDKVQDVKKNSKKIIKQLKADFLGTKNISMFKPGALLTYDYNAKDKTVVYDKRPLGICLGLSRQTKGNFYLLNFHHLSTGDRVRIASFFIELRKKKKGEITYEDCKPFLTKFKGKKVLRQYIYKRVSNRVIHIHDEEQFLVAASVDTADWFKPTKG